MTGPGGTSACTGPDNCVSQTQGIEIYGRGIAVGSNAPNSFSNYYNEGVYITNALNVSVTGNTFTNDGYAESAMLGAVTIRDQLSPSATRQGDTIMVTNNSFTVNVSALENINYAIALEGGTTPTPTNITLTGNPSFSGYLGGNCYHSPFSESGTQIVGVISSQFNTPPACY